MPWHIENDKPECSGFAVVKDSDGEIEGCFETLADAKAQLAALYANEPEEDGAEPDGESRKHVPPAEEIRASWPEAVELREAGEGGMPTMVGHFSRFNEWARIADRSGEFMERILPGAFARTLKNNRSSIRVLFQHGRDPQVGDKPLGPIADVREDAEPHKQWNNVVQFDATRRTIPGFEKLCKPVKAG